MSKQMPAYMEDGLQAQIGRCVLEGRGDFVRHLAAEYALYRDTWPTRTEWEAAVL